MSLLPDYSRQADTYDTTRHASPSVLAPLREALAGAPGRRLADIGGGTGNYAAALALEGWEPVVVDREAGMLEQAAAKGLATVRADAQELPFEDESFDAATMISMLHHVEDQHAALAEAQRILRPGGKLVLKGYAREDMNRLWLLDYFPSSRPWMDETHPTRAEILELLPGATLREIVFRDVDDASLAALAAHPDLLLERRWRTQISFFERLERDHPQELEAGLERLAEALAAGRPPRDAGTASVLSWTKPAL